MNHVHIERLAAVVCVGALSAVATGVRADAPRDQYVLRAVVDASAHSVKGTADITWTNRSRVAVNALWFHLYLNAFEEGSQFMRESGGQLRGVHAAGTGSIHLDQLSIDGGPDLLAGATDATPRHDAREGAARADEPDAGVGARASAGTTAGTGAGAGAGAAGSASPTAGSAAHPTTDVGVPHDRTQLRVPLARPLRPGGTVRIHVAFTSYLPPVFARTGYVDDFNMVAQWYPKLARLDPDGTWATFPYYALGEFYADFADYDLTVQVPLGYDVVSGGVPVPDGSDAQSGRFRFRAERVHDLPFVAARHLEHLGAQVDGVWVDVVYPPGYRLAAARHMDVVRFGLPRLSRQLTRYPYPRLTVVVPPRGAGGAAGMEYPTLFVGEGPWFPLPGLVYGGTEDTAAHELAHQWFQGLLASNEVMYPFLDEGLATWTGMDLMRALHEARRAGDAPDLPADDPLAPLSRALLAEPPLPADPFELLRVFNFEGTSPAPAPGLPAYDYDAADYGRAVYGRTALLLETIRRTWGDAKLRRTLHDYATRERFGHPRPSDLYDAFDRTYGSGFSDAVLRPVIEGAAVGGLKLDSVDETRHGAGWRVTVRASRTGALSLPTQVTVTHPHGPPSELAWPQSARTFEHTFVGERATHVAVDAQREDLLDPSRLDNAWSATPSDVPLFKRLWFLGEALLFTVGP